MTDTPTDPAFAGERIELGNGWSIRKCCSKGWVFFEPNGTDAVDHLPDDIARAFAATLSASAGVVPGLERALEIVQEGMRNFGTRFEGCDAEAHIESALNEARKAPRVALPTAQGAPDELRAVIAHIIEPVPWDLYDRFLQPFIEVRGCQGSEPFQLYMDAYRSGARTSAQASEWFFENADLASYLVKTSLQKADAILAAVSSSTAPGQE